MTMTGSRGTAGELLLSGSLLVLYAGLRATGRMLGVAQTIMAPSR
jgi:hypothetical protein